MQPIWIPVAAYLAVLAFVQLLQARELRRDADKRRRYQALPWAYRLLCPVFVLPWMVFPFFITAHVDGWWREALRVAPFLVGWSAFLLVRIACISWYRKNGYW